MNSTKKSMFLNILKIVLGVLGSLFVLLALFALPGDIKDLNLEEKTAAINNSKFGLMMGFTIFIVILGAVLVVGFFFFGLIKFIIDWFILYLLLILLLLNPDLN
jgi:hypothetical protein